MPELKPKKSVTTRFTTEEVEWINDIAEHFNTDASWVLRFVLKTVHKMMFPSKHTKNSVSDTVIQCNTPSDTGIYTLDSVTTSN